MFSQNLTDVTKVIAEFWADGPDSTAPPGHWYRIAMEAAMRQVTTSLEMSRRSMKIVQHESDFLLVRYRDRQSSFFQHVMLLIAVIV